jgi:hypothetical protein
MTILGKLLVFVVLILSIVWNALVVNSYVARTNWQKRAAEYEKKAQEAATSATNMKSLLEEERAAGEEARRAALAERDRLYAINNQLLKDRQDLVKQVNTAFEQAKTQGAQANIQQTNVEKLQQQVNTLDQQIKDMQKQLTDTTLSAQQDRVTAEKAKIDAAGRAQQAERLAVRVQQLSDELDEYRRTYGALQQIGPGAQRAPALPEAFRGTVRRTEGAAREFHAGNEIWVELTPGMDAGLKQGAILTVRRLNGAGGKYLGTITVARVNSKDAVGRFTPANPRAVTDNDLPKPGDELVPSTSNR